MGHWILRLSKCLRTEKVSESCLVSFGYGNTGMGFYFTGENVASPGKLTFACLPALSFNLAQCLGELSLGRRVSYLVLRQSEDLLWYGNG